MTEQRAIKILKEEMGWESDSGKIQAFAMAISALEEIQQYREIGTVDECREAVEKQKAKKPIDGCMFSGCPNCGDIEIQYCTYCPNCGQKLDWSEKPDMRSE